MSDKVFKANCNEHKTFMFFQDFLFFSEAALFFLPLPLGNVRAMISKNVAHMHTRKILQIIKIQPNASLPILILLQAEMEREYIILCTVRSILWHRLLVKMNYLCKKSLIKEKVLGDLCSKQC